jgi:hypothetical protein
LYEGQTGLGQRMTVGDQHEDKAGSSKGP